MEFTHQDPSQVIKEIKGTVNDQFNRMEPENLQHRGSKAKDKQEIDEKECRHPLQKQL